VKTTVLPPRGRVTRRGKRVEEEEEEEESLGGEKEELVGIQ